MVGHIITMTNRHIKTSPIHGGIPKEWSGSEIQKVKSKQAQWTHRPLHKNYKRMGNIKESLLAIPTQ